MASSHRSNIGKRESKALVFCLYSPKLRGSNLQESVLIILTIFSMCFNGSRKEMLSFPSR